LLGATPFLVGSIFVLASLLFALLAHLNPGRISLEQTLDVGHLTLLIDAVAFAMAIAIRLVGMRRDRDAAMLAELHSTREQLRLAEALQRSQAQYDAARELAARRQEELSSVTHDIAQPLASLRAAMTVMEGVDDATTRQMHAAFDYLEILARRNSVSDIGAGAAGTALEIFPVSAVLDNVFRMFGSEARAKALHLRYRSCDARVRGDPIALMRMVGNLVANAIKHTPSGAVLLACRRRKGCVSIEVWDTGPGMDANQLHAALERYVKGAHSEGQGLGLPLVKEMADKHGARFFLQSRPGKGTRAVLELAEEHAG
jgi:signal transduction histidine kinase